MDKKDKILSNIQDSDLSKATKRTYTSRVNSLWKIKDWQKDPLQTVEEMNPSSNLNSELNATAQILAIAKVSKTFKKMVDEDDMMDLRELYDKLKTAQKSIDRSAERPTDVTWSYLKSLESQLENKNITSDDRLLYALYIDPGIGFTPRLDFADMKFVDSMSDAEDDDKINYYVKDKKTMIFNQYKTKERYGSQKVKISAELDRMLPKHREWMFESGDEPLSDNALGKKVIRGFKRLSGGKHISVVTIRRAFASHIASLPEDERRKLSLRMGHSSLTNTSYAHGKSDSEGEDMDKRIEKLT